METLSNLAFGRGIARSGQNSLYCFIGGFLGTRVGGLPGIGPVATTSLIAKSGRVFEDVITRCRELNLRLVKPPEEATLEFTILLTVQTMNYLHSGRHRVAL